VEVKGTLMEQIGVDGRVKRNIGLSPRRPLFVWNLNVLFL